MADTGTSLVAVKAQLVSRLTAALSGVTVGYGEPRQASDVTDTSGVLRSIWLGDAQGRSEYPYMVGTTAKPTREVYGFEVTCQALVQSETTDGQQEADTLAVALFYEVSSTIALDPTLGLSSPKPLCVEVESWRHVVLDRDASAWGAQFVIQVQVEADIGVPS